MHKVSVAPLTSPPALMSCMCTRVFVCQNWSGLSYLIASMACLVSSVEWSGDKPGIKVDYKLRGWSRTIGLYTSLQMSHHHRRVGLPFGGLDGDIHPSRWGCGISRHCDRA